MVVRPKVEDFQDMKVVAGGTSQSLWNIVHLIVSSPIDMTSITRTAHYPAHPERNKGSAYLFLASSNDSFASGSRPVFPNRDEAP